jgi:hypothetical protein
MTKPFKSKFLPYVDQIKAWRRAGRTWQEVAEQLTSMGIKADAGNVCRVMGRIKRRPYPIGAEPEEPKKEHQAASPAPGAPLRSVLHARRKASTEDHLSTEDPREDQPPLFKIHDNQDRD